MQRSLRNRLIYAVLIFVCIIPLYLLGQPSTLKKIEGREEVTPGGVLSQLRMQEGLAEVQLGEIDPTSSTIKLATLGLRGVAVSILWHQSLEFKKRLDWNNAIATGNQIVRLEPHFVSIWEFLGWDWAYNASVEFDDYRERYRWLIRGFDFLVEGTKYNRTIPKLFHNAGWVMSQKIGVADEKVQYRRLLKEDEEFHKRYMTPLDTERDNWLIGRIWYHQAEALAPEGTNIGKQAGPNFFAHSRMNLIHYATWLALDGRFGDDNKGEYIKNRWEIAQEEWHKFGLMNFKTAIPKKDGSEGVEETTLLKTVECEAREKELIEQLKGLSPGLYEKLVIANWDKLLERSNGEELQASLLPSLTYTPTPARAKYFPVDEEWLILRRHLDETAPDWREKFKTIQEQTLRKALKAENEAILDIPELLLDEQQSAILGNARAIVGQMSQEATASVRIDPRLLADRVEGDQRPQALKIREELNDLAKDKHMSNLFREILNYPYWADHVVVERQDETLRGRRGLFEARKKYAEGEQKESNRLWLGAMQGWEDLLHKPGFEYVANDSQFLRTIENLVTRYVIILDAEERLFPEKFPLQDLVREKINAVMPMDVLREAFLFAEKTYNEGDYARALTYLTTIVHLYDRVNASEDYMKLAPLPDVRDDILKAAALFVNCLRKQDFTLPPNFELKPYIDLMLKNDPIQSQAVELSAAGSVLLGEEKYHESQAKFDEAMELWKVLLEKYPLIYLEQESLCYGVLTNTAHDYQRALELQGKVLPEDFPLKEFLK
ncbi:MAG: hypothetical protein FWC43_01165 [Planctomycetaceae bacterium]|nr:hypothetical protein [Planctomycetaceae bacterium]